MGAYLRNNIWQISWGNPANPKKPFRKSTGMKNEEAWDEGEKRYITKAEIKKKAEAMAAKKGVDIAEGKNLDIKREELVKFKDFAILYFETYSKINLKKPQNDWTILDPENPKGLIANFGEMYLNQIKPLDIERYKQRRLQEDKVKASTVNAGLKLLSSMFNKAVKWEKVFKNPCQKIDRLTEKNNRLRYFTIEELQKIFPAINEPIKSMAKIAVTTGMRRFELVDLQWRDVDLVKNQICLVDQKNNKVEYVSIKHVRELFVNIPVNEHSTYVFNSCYNTKYNEQYITNFFGKVLKRLGIKEASFHTLRHSFASHLAMAGVGLYTISKLMRHSSIKMTERYAHLSKEHSELALDSLTARFDTLIERKDTNNAHSKSEVENKEFENIVNQMKVSS